MAKIRAFHACELRLWSENVWVPVTILSLSSLICKMGVTTLAHKAVMRIQWNSGRLSSWPARPSPAPRPEWWELPTPSPFRPQAGLLCSGHFLSPAEPAAWPARRRSHPLSSPADCQRRVTGRTRPGLQGRVCDSVSSGACGFPWPVGEWTLLKVPVPASLGCQSLPLPPCADMEAA